MSFPHSKFSDDREFFGKEHCDRCSSKLFGRTMSWFTTETLCMQCSEKEQPIKAELRAAGDKTAMEGCGFVPNHDHVVRAMNKFGGKV